MAFNIMHLCRNTEVFGEDAHIFNPDRWIAAARDDKERYAKMCRTGDLIFGNGKYECIGKHIAFLELNKVFVEVSFFFFLVFFLAGDLGWGRKGWG